MSLIHLAAGGSNTAPYDTWAKAATTLAAAIAAMVAGDDLLIDSAYTETTAATSFAFPGTDSNPCRILSGTHAGASGLDALAEGATITMTTTSPMTITGSHSMYGVLWINSSGSSVTMSFGSNDGDCQELSNCTARLTGTGSSASIIFGNQNWSQGSKVVLRNQKFRFGHANQMVNMRGRVEVRGGSIESGGTAPTNIFSLDSQGRGACLDVTGFDATNAGTGVNLWYVGHGAPVLMRDCTVATGWTGSVLNATGRRPGCRVECWGLKVGSTKTRATIRDYFGDIADSSSVYRTGGATDTAPHSYSMTSTANCGRSAPLISPAMILHNTTIGTARTITLETIRDNATALTDKEFWIEVHSPDGQVVRSLPSDLASAASLTSSTEAWTDGGMANANKRKVSVSLTPTVSGPFIVYAMLAKPSTTVYFDWPPIVA